MEMSHEAGSSYLHLDSSLERDKFNAVLLNHVGLSKYTKLFFLLQRTETRIIVNHVFTAGKSIILLMVHWSKLKHNCSMGD